MKMNARRKMIAMLLALSLLLTGFPGTAVWAETSEAEQPVQLASEQTEQTVSEAQPVQEVETFQLDADCKILNYVHAEVFAHNDHAARLKEEETLSTYVFRNTDGSKTVYYMDENVKFLDENGIAKEKDITLMSAKDGYSTRQNNIKLLLPNDPASGIRMQYDGHTVTLIPQGGSLRTTPQLVNNSVRYGGYFGENTSLNYTPTLDGIKEDIVLSAYTGVNAFTFTLNTGGLNLYQSGEKYFLAESKLAENRIQLNEIEVYDANLKPCRGTLTVKTVMPGQRYDITVSVSEEYLTDPTTVYPVTIDPTLTISDANSSGSILDAPLYQGYPYSNFGSYIYNRAGYAGSDYGIGRTVVRLSGFLTDIEYAETEGANIDSVKFYISEADGASPRTVGLYPLTTNYSWTESNVTWNNVGYHTNASWATASLSYGNYACFDITNLAKAWKNGTYNGYCGFMLKGSNESSVDTVLLSSEYTSRAPYAVAVFGGGGGEPVVPPTPEPEPDPEVVLNHSSITTSENQVHQLSATVTPSGSTVTWSSNNPSVASVNSSGRVTTHQVGQATITASTADASDTCVITVRIPEGVYYIKNDTSGLCLGTTGGITDGTGVSLRNRSTADPTRLFQLWEVEYLGYGSWYTIRPLYKPDMVLGAGNLFVNIYEGTNSTPDHVKWYITGSESSGYMLKNNNSSIKVLQPEIDYGAPGTSIIIGEYDDLSEDNDKYFWSLEAVTGVGGVLLYDGTSLVSGTPPTKYMVKGKLYSLAELNLNLYACGANASQTFTWSCRDADGVLVSSDIFTAYQQGSTYRIKINAVGIYTVTGTNAFGSKSFHVEVIPLEDGTYYIQSPSSNKHLEYGSEYPASVYQDWICGGSSQKWIFTHRGDGTYSIKPAGSSNGNYLGPASSVAEGQPVTCQSTNYGWKIVEDQQTDGSYGILLAADTTLAATLASNSASSGVGLALNQHNLNDLSFSDEWRLLKEGPGILLVGVLDTGDPTEIHDHESSLSASIPHFRVKGYKNLRVIISDTVSTADLQSALADAQIFISRSHGNVTNNSTYLLLSPEEPAPPMTLDTSDIYDFSTRTVITDMSNCDLAIFAACYTAAHPTQSLIDAAYKAGAKVAAGFEQGITCLNTIDWFESFFAYYNPEGAANEGSQYTIEEALHLASYHNQGGGLDTIRVVSS